MMEKGNLPSSKDTILPRGRDRHCGSKNVIIIMQGEICLLEDGGILLHT